MILFALLVAHRVNSNCYKAQRRIYTKVAFTCVMDYTSLTGNFETGIRAALRQRSETGRRRSREGCQLRKKGGCMAVFR